MNWIADLDIGNAQVKFEFLLFKEKNFKAHYRDLNYW